MMSGVLTYITYEKVQCQNPCYTRNYDVSCPNLHKKCVMARHMLHTSMRLFSVQSSVTYENV